MALDDVPRTRLAALPTPLEGPLPIDDTEVRLWVKRDDLTGLGGGGNKARKLEFLCGEAVARGADTLITVGAEQSNHCRMTAAAGALLGLDVHLVLSGDRPSGPPTGNLLLDELFGAQLHFTGAAQSHWGELEIAREALGEELSAGGATPYSIPIGGSTPVGALGYAAAAIELAEQCATHDIRPAAVVFTSSSGGTHAGLLAGQQLAALKGSTALTGAEITAVGVAKGVAVGAVDVHGLATAALALAGEQVSVSPDDVIVEADFLGPDYGVPTEAGDDAIRWAGRTAGLLLDRTYSGKGLSGALALARSGRWPAGSDIVFVHTGGWPALFATDGVPT